jgi:hypothetical protein
MAENASLSDYLFELRRSAAPGRLRLAIAFGALFTVAGLILGGIFLGLTGFGLSIAGVSAWARLNQIADSMMGGEFIAQNPARARRLRATGLAALGLGAIGALIVLYAFVTLFLHGATGL